MDLKESAEGLQQAGGYVSGDDVEERAVLFRLLLEQVDIVDRTFASLGDLVPVDLLALEGPQLAGRGASA